MKQRTQIALYVAFLGLAVAMLLSTSVIGSNLLDRNAPEWLIELHRFFVQISMTAVVFTVVSAIFAIFVFSALNLLRPSILAKVMDYALACLFGCALAIALCITAAVFEANRHPTGNGAGNFYRAVEFAEKNTRSSANAKWGQLTDLYITAAVLASAEYFVDHAGNYLMPGILLPPMFLYIWKRRKK